MNNQPELLTPEETADFLKVKVRQVYRYMRDKVNPLQYIQITSSTRRIKKEVLMQWLAGKAK